MAERNAKKILLQILQQARDEATSPDPADLGVLADRFLERWPSSPLPDSETEWGRRWPDSGITQPFPSRAAAEEYEGVPPEHAFAGSRLVCRTLGPWIEVTS